MPIRIGKPQCVITVTFFLHQWSFVEEIFRFASAIVVIKVELKATNRRKCAVHQFFQVVDVFLMSRRTFRCEARLRCPVRGKQLKNEKIERLFLLVKCVTRDYNFNNYLNAEAEKHIVLRTSARARKGDEIK